MSDSTEDLDAGNGGVEVLDRQKPLPIARKFRTANFSHPDDDSDPGTSHATLWHSGGVFYEWDGIAYREAENNALRSRLYGWLDKQVTQLATSKGEVTYVPFNPRKGDVDQVIDALKSECYAGPHRPAWLRPDVCDIDPQKLMVAKNGVFDLFNDSDSILFPPTPLLLTTNALDYDFQPDAPEPTEWLQFLDQLWPDDRESIQLIQEWFGYVLTQETRQQKILMLVGPPRSGKGTILRIVSSMVGIANVCAPTLAGLGTNFGLAPLVGKTLATISDARLSGRTDQAIVAERLLTISGEDSVTIDRKHREAWTGKLPTRIMLCTNELPRLNDSSGALANRFLVLPLTRSFLGEEDTGLTDRLMAGLPGILNWSVDGWRRLRTRGSFVQSATGQDAIDELNDLSSPVGAFVREYCVIRAGASIPTNELYEAYGAWCAQQGREPGDAARFGRDLRAVVPGIGSGQRRTDRGRERVYEGIDVSLAGSEMTSQYRSSRVA